MRRRAGSHVAALAVLALSAGGCRPHGQAAAAAPASSSAAVGGPFQLIDQDGRPVSDRDLLGKPSVVFFGFTYCPDVCPTTLAGISDWMKALGPDADGINLVFVTIDPDRDTPAVLKRYLASFDPRFRGFTGSDAAVAQAEHAYAVYAQKVALAGGGYTMDHSTNIYLMGRDGRFAELLSTDETTPEALAALHRALKG